MIDSVGNSPWVPQICFHNHLEKKHTADAVKNSMHSKSIRVKLSKHSFSGQFSTKILEPQTLKTSPWLKKKARPIQFLNISLWCTASKHGGFQRIRSKKWEEVVAINSMQICAEYGSSCTDVQLLSWIWTVWDSMSTPAGGIFVSEHDSKLRNTLSSVQMGDRTSNWRCRCAGSRMQQSKY